MFAVSTLDSVYQFNLSCVATRSLSVRLLHAVGVFKVNTLVWANQRNYFEIAITWSSRTLKTRVATLIIDPFFLNGLRAKKFAHSWSNGKFKNRPNTTSPILTTFLTFCHTFHCYGFLLIQKIRHFLLRSQDWVCL